MSITLPSLTNYNKITILHDNSLPLMLSGLKRTTDFVVDKRNEAGEYGTYLVNYGVLSNMNVEYIRTAKEVNLHGTWILSGNNNHSTMCLGLNQLVLADQKYSTYHYNKNTAESSLSNYGNAAITYEFYKKIILKKINDLSTEIFHKPHVPSYIGMMLYSNTLASEDAVKRIYGGKKWERVSFAFMCGHARNGNAEENDYEKYGNLAKGAFKPSSSTTCGYGRGGEEYVTLEEKHLPDHDHNIKFDKTEFTVVWNGEVRYSGGEVKSGSGVLWTTPGIHHTRCPGDSGNGKPGTKTFSSLKAKVSGTRSISTARAYKSSLTIDGLYDSSGTRKTTNPKLLNIPPFETKYVWIRKE